MKCADPTNRAYVLSKVAGTEMCATLPSCWPGRQKSVWAASIQPAILMDSANILKCVEKLTSWGYKPKIPVDPKDLASEEKRKTWLLEKGMKAFNFYNEELLIAEIDLVMESSVSYEKLKSHAVRINLQGVMAPTVSISDLIEMKRGPGRKQDLVDIEYLRKILER